MRKFAEIIAWLQTNPASWPALDFGEWPTGLRHDFSWHCTKRALHVARQMDQEPKQGSWYALAAKRKWIAGKLSTQGMRKSIQMAQLSMLPEDLESGGDWFQQERADYENILSGIQEDLSPQERAWIESDTAKYIAQDALSRLIWSTIQLDPPSLPDIVRMFHRVIRNLAATQAWSANAQHDWFTIQDLVREQVRARLDQEASWQKQKLLTLLQLHHQFREQICSYLLQFAQHKEQSRQQWHNQWEEALFS